VFFQESLHEVVGTYFGEYLEKPVIFENMLTRDTQYQPFTSHRVRLVDIADPVTLQLFRDDNNEFCLLIMESLQVTEEVLVAREERKWAERLQIMLFGISHELKTPLAIARGYAELIPTNTDPDAPLKTMDALDSISGILNNMTEPIRELKDDQDIVDLGRGLEMYCKTMPYTEPTKRYIGDFEADFEAASGKTIQMLKPRLYQILTNLFENSIRATDHLDTEAKVEIRTFLCEKHHHHSCIVVEFSDNGCGMDKETADKVFTPYFTTRAPDTGSGLGGYFIYQFVMDAGGTIEIDSEEGKGTTFRAHFPYQP